MSKSVGSSVESDVDSDVESVNSQQLFEDDCERVMQATGLLAEELKFTFAPKGSEERKQQEAAIWLGILQPPPKYTDQELVVRAVHSFYTQSLLLEGDLKDYCAVCATLFLVIFPSTNPDTLEMSVRLLAYLAKDPRFESYVRFVRNSVLDPIVKKRVSDISRFWNETLGTGVFDLSQRGFNYNNFHRTAEQISDMPRDGSHITDLFLGFFLQWLPRRQKGLDFCASRWHKNAEVSFGYAATLLFKGMK
jgi:hypothetical protein